MLIQIPSDGSAARVVDVDDLKRFSVVAPNDISDDGIRTSLGALGRLETSEHAWISITELRSCAGSADDASWALDFDAMVAYAASRGWVDEGRTSLRAHVERRVERRDPS